MASGLCGGRHSQRGESQEADKDGGSADDRAGGQPGHASITSRTGVSRAQRRDKALARLLGSLLRRMKAQTGEDVRHFNAKRLAQS